MAGSINSTGAHNGTYFSVGNAAIKAAKPRLELVYDRDALDRDVRRPGVSKASRKSRMPKTSSAARAQNCAHRSCEASAASAAIDARAFLRLVVIGVIVLCCSVVFEGIRSSRITQTLDSAPVEEVKAITGDTLWSIAEQYCGSDVPTDDVVTWIRSRNGLSSAMLTPGQRISVPVVAE